MNIEHVSDCFLPIDKFYETSLNLSQPLFPKDLDKIKINGSAYLKKNRGLVALDPWEDDEFYTLQVAEDWFCLVYFEYQEIQLGGTFGSIKVERENLQETYIEIASKVDRYYGDITAFDLITQLYEYYLKIHSKLLQVKIQFQENEVKWSANDCLKSIVRNTGYEACPLAFEPESDLPF